MRTKRTAGLELVLTNEDPISANVQRNMNSAPKEMPALVSLNFTPLIIKCYFLNYKFNRPWFGASCSFGKALIVYL